MKVREGESLYKIGTLTKKDFVKFALKLSEIDDDTTRKMMIDAQIPIFRETNPRFDEARFRKFIEDKTFERRMGFKRK